MKTRLFAILSLLAILLTACSSGATSTQPAEDVPATPGVLAPTATPVVDLTITSVSEGSQNAAAPSPTVQAIATSRGPKLEATDPKTVSMASGGLQLVEFFEFW